MKRTAKQKKNRISTKVRRGKMKRYHDQVSQYINEGNPNIQSEGSKNQEQPSSDSSEGSQKEGTFFPDVMSVPSEEDGQEIKQKKSDGPTFWFPLHERGECHPGDQKLAEDIQAAIERHPALFEIVHAINITVENGVVVLEGDVSTQEEKMIVQHQAATFAGLDKVDNQLRVISQIKG